MAILIPRITPDGDPTAFTSSFTSQGPTVVSLLPSPANITAALQVSADDGTTWTAIKPDVILNSMKNYEQVNTTAGYLYRFSISGTARNSAKLWYAEFTSNSYRSL